jgi:hypothetical protein
MAAGPAATAELPTILVRVDNDARVPPDLLQFAEERAAAVFARIGAGIRWIDQEEVVRGGIRPAFTVVVAVAQGQGDASRFVEALGVAHPSVRRAYVFYDRVADLNIGASRSVPSLLGDVIAHELGHLMLRPPSHSAGGIMRPELEMKSWALQTFTGPQAREVLSRIRTMP